MNEEEIKAVEYLKFKIKDFEENYGVGITTKQIENFKTVLNLIEKQKAEIIKANKQKHNQSSLRRLNERKMRKYRAENKELKAEIDKRSKFR